MTRLILRKKPIVLSGSLSGDLMEAVGDGRTSLMEERGAGVTDVGV